MNKKTAAGSKIHTPRETTRKKGRIKRIVKDKSKSFYDFVNKFTPKKSSDEKNLAIQIK